MNQLMNSMRRALGRSTILNDQRGLTTVEYVIVLVIVAATAVGLWRSFGGIVQGHIKDANEDMTDLSPTAPKQ